MQDGTPLNYGRIDRPKTAKTRGIAQNPSILGSSLVAFEPSASRKDQKGFDLISANSSFRQ
jgi:hypothetical protein